MSLAARKLKFQLVFSSLLVVLALLVTWLLLGESSPLHDYFVWHGELPDVWAMTTLLPFILSALITGNPHSPSMVIFIFLLIVQWTLFGFFLSVPLSRIFVRQAAFQSPTREPTESRTE